MDRSKKPLFSFSKIIIVSLCFTVLYLGCKTQDTVWGFEKEKFTQSLRSGEWDFLLDIDFRKINKTDVLRIPEGGVLYTSVILEKLGLNRTAEELLMLSWEKEKHPWSFESARILCQKMIRQERYVESERFAEQVLESYPAHELFVYTYLESLYRQEKDDRILQLMEKYLPVIESDDFLNGEAALWKAVASFRTEIPDWKDAFVRLYTRHTASLIHARVYRFLKHQKPVPEFHSDLTVLFGAIADAAEFKWKESEAKFSEFFAPQGKILENRVPYLTKDVLHTIYQACVHTNRSQTWGNRLFELSLARKNPDADVLEYSGRCYRLAGSYSKGEVLLNQAYNAAEKPSDKKRILWYRLSCLQRESQDLFLANLPEAVNLIEDGGYFADIFETVLSELITQRRWQDVFHVYRIMRERFDNETAASYGLVIFLAVEEGLYKPAGSDKVWIRSSFNQDVLNTPSMSFASIIGDAMLNREPRYSWTTQSAQKETSHDTIASGYFYYGIYPEGYRYILENHESVSDQLLTDAAMMLKNAGFYTWALRIWNRLKENQFSLNSPTIKSAYPEAFEKDMSAVIDKYSLPEEIFYALIREESYFDSEVISWAGAVGLAQLMPSTAEDIAGRLNMEIDDLTDPGTNLLLGGWYLGWLLDMFDLPLYALAAYNGGQSRVKKWVKENGDLPTVLFVETIPLWETRGYIKKVLVSSVIYGYLYDHLSVRAAVLKFFPDLPEISGRIQE